MYASLIYHSRDKLRVADNLATLWKDREFQVRQEEIQPFRAKVLTLVDNLKAGLDENVELIPPPLWSGQPNPLDKDTIEAMEKTIQFLQKEIKALKM